VSTADTHADPHPRRRTIARAGQVDREKARTLAPRARRSRPLDVRRSLSGGRRVMAADSMQTASANARDDHDAAPAELGERWHRGVVLKRDIFSIVERGSWRGPDGDVDAVARRIDQVPWWTYAFARNFLAREARALT